MDERAEAALGAGCIVGGCGAEGGGCAGAGWVRTRSLARGVHALGLLMARLLLAEQRVVVRWAVGWPRGRHTSWRIAERGWRTSAAV